LIEMGGIAIGGVNMWALLLDGDPGHSAEATDLATDVDQKLKKTAIVEVEQEPSGRNVAKPAKRADKAKKSKKSAAGDSKQAAKVQIDGAAPATMPDRGQLADRHEETKETLATLPWKEEEDANEEMFKARGGRRRTVAPVAGGIATGGANMLSRTVWADAPSRLGCGVNGPAGPRHEGRARPTAVLIREQGEWMRRAGTRTWTEGPGMGRHGSLFLPDLSLYCIPSSPTRLL
jgi:hypothetical protein